MNMVSVNINGKNILVEDGSMILKVAEQMNIKIPYCYNFMLHILFT